MDWKIGAAFALYFGLVLAIGFVASRRKMSEKDFIMGGRKLNFWLTALSAHASDMSAWLFMAFPSAVFLAGVPGCWIALGLLGGMYVNWQCVAPRIRQQTEDLDSYTLATFFERRFRDNSGLIRCATAILTLIFFSHYLAALLRAMGLLLAPLFHMDYATLIVTVTVLVVIYTFMGGYVAVAWIDCFQALFLLAVVLAVPVYAYMQLSDPSDIVALAHENGKSLSLFPHASWNWVISEFSVALSWGLGYFGMPHVLTKFMGIKNVSQIYKSKYLGMTWLVFTLAGAAAVGLIGIGFFPLGLEEPEMVFVEMVKELFHPFLAGFVLCAVLAANLSTMDSQILCCATTISEDLYRLVRRGAVPARELLLVSRIGVVAVAFFALSLAFYKDAPILASVLYPWAGLGCTFGPLVILGLYSKKINKYGAAAGIVFGGCFSMFWPDFRTLITNYDISAIILGFPLNALLTYVVSILTQDKSTKLEKQPL